MKCCSEIKAVALKRKRANQKENNTSAAAAPQNCTPSTRWYVCQHKRLVATRYTSAFSRCVEGEWTSVGRNSTARERHTARGSALKGWQAREESAAESCKITDTFTSSVTGSGLKKKNNRRATLCTSCNSAQVDSCYEKQKMNMHVKLDLCDLSCRVEASWW